MGLFSYMDEAVWLLKRCHISILLQKESERDDAMVLREGIISKGGNASVLTLPEVRWNSINIISEPLQPLPAWRWYFVKFYSIKLLLDAGITSKFNRDDIEKYEIRYEPPPVLNMRKICSYLF